MPRRFKEPDSEDDVPLDPDGELPEVRLAQTGAMSTLGEEFRAFDARVDEVIDHLQAMSGDERLPAVLDAMSLQMMTHVWRGTALFERQSTSNRDKVRVLELQAKVAEMCKSAAEKTRKAQAGSGKGSAAWERRLGVVGEVK